MPTTMSSASSSSSSSSSPSSSCSSKQDYTIPSRFLQKQTNKQTYKRTYHHHHHHHLVLMTLRLSTSSPSSSSCGNPVVDRLLQDAALSTEQKMDCIKTLSVVIKNLLDPIKSQDAKYRTLKVDNAKLQQRMLGISYITQDLLKASVGFAAAAAAADDDDHHHHHHQTTTIGSPAEAGERVLTVQVVDLPVCQALQTSLTAAMAQLSPETTTTTTTTNGTVQNKKPRVTTTTTTSSSTTTVDVVAAAVVPVPEKLSEKQKARRLLAAKEEVEKQTAKEERRRNIALLKQDKLTRETDPNWKPGLSAACAKSGTSISTFRDKYGEQ